MLLRDLDIKQLPAPLAAISSEHRFSLRVLALVEQEIQALSQGLLADVRLLREALHFFHHVLDAVHHPREELIFQRMLEGAGSATLETIAQLQQGHHDMTDMAVSLLQDCHRRRLLMARQRKRLSVKLSRYVRGLHSHMRAEEVEIYQPALKLLTAADWQQIEDKLASLPNAICGINQAPEYAWLLDRYLNQVVQVSSAGVPYALVDRVASLVERSVHGGLSVARFIARKPKPVWHDNSHASAACSLSSEQELMTYGERPGVYRRGWSMSWQAAGMSIALRAGIKPLMGAAPVQLSGWMRRHPSIRSRVPAGVSMQPVNNAAYEGRWFQPKGLTVSRRVVMYLPGGAFVFPASNGHSQALARLVRGCEAKGLMVDYRLVPEHPFPAQIEDALNAYRDLLGQGYAPEQIALAGDSAGGGLVLSLLQEIRSHGLPMPACAACFSPFADMSLTAPSHRENRWADPVLPSPFPQQTMRQYVGDTPVDHPLISPVNGDYSDCPPLLIHASSSEVLRGDSLRVARKARAHGVDVELQIWDALPHAWHVFPQLPESRAALNQVAEFFCKQFEPIAARRLATQAAA